MKATPFKSMHEKLGAKMVPFAGYTMPLEYIGITDEHMCVRQSVGVFDVSHMGEICVKGEYALKFLQWVTSNDVSKLSPGRIQYSCLPNGEGGIIDDLLVYCYKPEKYLLVVNAANTDKDYNWLQLQNKFGVELENKSDQIAQLAVQGPKAVATLQKLTSIKLSEIPYYSFVKGKMAGINEVLISNTGYTGAGGFELYCNNIDAENIWNAVFEAGKEFGIKPIGLGARDTLRIEMGYCLYGNDIDDTTSSIEAGLGWITKFESYKDFIDKQLLFEQKKKGVNRKLIGFKMIDRGIPRHGYEIHDAFGKVIGHVTSGTMSPVLKIGIGMGYVSIVNANPQTYIFIHIRDKQLKAQVVDFPFIEKM